MSGIDPQVVAWRKAGKHLPAFMKDFHNQKDLFAAMHELTQWAQADIGGDITPTEGMCYVLDGFLWFMARHGYTLQKTRADLPFEDIQANIAAVREEHRAKMNAAMKNTQNLEANNS